MAIIGATLSETIIWLSETSEEPSWEHHPKGTSCPTECHTWLIRRRQQQQQQSHPTPLRELNSKTVVTATEHLPKQSNEIPSSTLVFTHFEDGNNSLCLNGDRNALLSHEGPFDLSKIQQSYDHYLKYAKKNKGKSQWQLNCAFFTNALLNKEMLDYFEVVAESDSTHFGIREIDLECYRLSRNKLEMFKEEWERASRGSASQVKKKLKVDDSTTKKRGTSVEQLLKNLTFYVYRQSKKFFEADLDGLLESKVRSNVSPSLRKLDVYDFYVPELTMLLVKSSGKLVSRDHVLKLIQHNQAMKRTAVRGVTQFYSTTLDPYHLHFEHGCLNTLDQFIYNPSSAIILNVVAAKEETAITSIKLRSLIRNREHKAQEFSLFLSRNMLNQCLVHAICEYFTVKPELPALRGSGRYFLVIEAAGPPSKEFTRRLEQLRSHFARKDSPFRILVITRADDESLSGLQNISSLRDTELKWQDLSVKSQNNLLNKQVEYQQSRITLQSLILDNHSFIKQHMDFNVLTELMDVCDVTLDFDFGCCEDFCVSRTLRRCEIIDGNAIESDDLISRLCLNAHEFEDRCKEEPNEGHHLVSQFDETKPGWLIWRRSSGGLIELRDFLISEGAYPAVDEQRSRRGEIKDDEFVNLLIKKTEETGKVVLIHGKDRRGTACVLSNLAKKISLRTTTGHLGYWVVKCDWQLPASFERSAGLSSKALDVLVNYLVKWPSDRKNGVAKALLRHRLENVGGRVVLMFHGDVEPNSLPALEKTIRSLNALPGVERILVTCTDSGNLIKVENALNQFAFHINDIKEADCLSSLIKCWTLRIDTAISSDSLSLMEKFGKILLSKATFLSELNVSEKVKVIQIAANSFHSDLEKFIVTNGQELCLKLDRPRSLFNLADLYRMFTSSACNSLGLPFIEHVNVANVKSFVQCHAMLSLDINAVQFFPQLSSFAMKGKKVPLLHDAACKMGFTLSHEGSNVVFDHDSLRDFFVADYFYALCSQEDGDSDLLFYLFVLLMQDVVKFRAVLHFVDMMLHGNVHLGENLVFSFDEDAVFTHCAFNGLLFQSGLDVYRALNIAFDCGLCNVFCWILTCAKEKLTRSSQYSEFHDKMLKVLDVEKCCDLVLKVISSHGRIDSIVVAHLLKWFENGERNVLEALLDGLHSIAQKVNDPKALENSYDVLRVLVEFIASHRVDISHSFTNQWFFESNDSKVSFMTLMAKVLAETCSDARVKKQILTLLPSVFCAKGKDELGELLSTWLSKLDLHKVKDRLFLKQCTLFMCFSVQSERARLDDTLKEIFASDPRILQTYNHSERALAGHLKAWEHGTELNSFISNSQWLSACEKAVLFKNLDAVEQLLNSNSHGCSEEIITEFFKALSVAVRTGNKDACDLITKLVEQFRGGESSLPHLINDCVHSALVLATSFLDHEWINQMLEAAESLFLSKFFNDSNLLTQLAKSYQLFWEEKCLSTDHFFPILTKIVNIWDKRREQRTISEFFTKTGYRAFKCLALQKSNALLKPILESVFSEDGDIHLIYFIFNPTNEDGSLERACQLLNNRQVREFVPGRLSCDGLKCFVEFITRDSGKENSLNVWKVYCSQRNKPSSHIKEIISCTRERCDINLTDEEQDEKDLVSPRSLNPAPFMNLNQVESGLKTHSSS